MEVLHPRCAGLDVHKKTVVAAFRIQEGNQVEVTVETFPTTTSGLLDLCGRIEELRIGHAAMEATGVYWKPVWHVLSGHVELLLANARHVKNLPGRKSDVKDAEWIADLDAHGLITGSFVPPADQQDLRNLTRTRVQLVRERTRHVARLHKVLEDANIKLTSFISDVLGVSGRRVLAAIIAGETDPDLLLKNLLVPRLKAKAEDLRESLRGFLRDHHRFMLKLHLEQIDSIDEAISRLDVRIDGHLRPFRYARELLTTVPGLSTTAANVVLAEVGADMSHFPTGNHLVSWACLCPRSDSSAGKRRSKRTMKGSHWLKPVLVQCAWSAVRVKGSYLRTLYYRLRARRGSKRAIIAVAASMLESIYHMLRDGVEYADLGAEHFDRVDQISYADRLVKKLQRSGYEVTIRKVA